MEVVTLFKQTVGVMHDVYVDKYGYIPHELKHKFRCLECYPNPTADFHLIFIQLEKVVVDFHNINIDLILIL